MFKNEVNFYVLCGLILFVKNTRNLPLLLSVINWGLDYKYIDRVLLPYYIETAEQRPTSQLAATFWRETPVSASLFSAFSAPVVWGCLRLWALDLLPNHCTAVYRCINALYIQSSYMARLRMNLNKNSYNRLSLSLILLENLLIHI